MAYVRLIYHIIWRTKDSAPTIAEEYERELFKYIWGTAKAMGCYLYRINSMPDHLHMLVEIPPNISVSELVRTITMSAGRYMKEHKDWFPSFMGWAKSYCAITYSLAERDTIINYIATQKEHHKKLSFSDELKKIMQEVGIKYDEKYFLKE